MEANLIITYEPTHKGKAGEEIKELLNELTEFEFLDSEYDGLFLLLTKKDPKNIVARLYDLCKEEPYKFRYTFRWIPVEKWTNTNIEDLSNAIRHAEDHIKPEESWKMDLGKRGFEGDTMNMVAKLTENISRPKVDLKNPQKIVKIEIIGGRAGVSILNAKEYLNVTKMKG